MRILIVDDSGSDRQSLRLMLQRISGMEIVAEAANLQAARKVLNAHAIDLVFLDIELGREIGFRLMEGLCCQPLSIITSVHRQYAEQAFDIAAVDYLVKPVTEERLLRALARASRALGHDARNLSLLNIQRGGSTTHLLAIETISLIQADGNFSMVHCGAQRYPDSRSLRDWQALLQELPFERVDRSTLLRIDHIRSIQPYGRGCILQFQNGNQPVELGRAAWERLRVRTVNAADAPPPSS